MSTVTFFGFHQNTILQCGIKKRNNFKYLVDFETCRVGCYFGVWSGGVWPFNRVRSTSFFFYSILAERFFLCLVAVSLLSLPKKLRCGWLSTGLALALAWPSRRFFFSHGSPISSIFTAAHAVAQSSARPRLPKWLVGKEGNRTLLDVSK